MVGEVIEVQNSLFNVRQQIEQLTAQKANLEQAASLSTLQVSLFEPGAGFEPRPVDDDKGLAHAFERAADGAVAVVAGMILVVGWSIPIVVLGLIIWGEPAVPPPPPHADLPARFPGGRHPVGTLGPMGDGPLRIAGIASHNGTNLRHIDTACRAGTLDAELVVLLSNNGDASILDYARDHGIEWRHLSSRTHPDPDALDQAIADTLRQHRVDLVFLSGYMKRLGPRTVGAFRNRVLNIHPALLPAYGGEGMYGDRVYDAVRLRARRRPVPACIWWTRSTTTARWCSSTGCRCFPTTPSRRCGTGCGRASPACRSTSSAWWPGARSTSTRWAGARRTSC